MRGQITKLTEAYEIDGILFRTKEEAAIYKYRFVDEVELGDVVSLIGGFKSITGTYGLQGRVCRIEGDSIWFVKGNCPEELIMSGKLDFEMHPHSPYKYKGEKYAWELCCRKRKDLSRSAYGMIDEREWIQSLITDRHI